MKMEEEERARRGMVRREVKVKEEEGREKGKEEERCVAKNRKVLRIKKGCREGRYEREEEE